MLQLIYVSTAVPTLTKDDVARILIQSRRNNRTDQLTGLLYHDGRRFMQALEGTDEAVARAFDRISADPRHHSIRSLSRREVDEREFGTWAMASRPFGSITAQEMTVMVESLVHRASPAVRQHFADFESQAA